MNITETPEWVDDIVQISTSDSVLGGEKGTSNKQAQQLANRTAYLKQLLEGGGNGILDLLPVGFTMFWPLPILPSNKWMERNGDILNNPVIYADYFARFGNTYGGNGVTTSALPDDRGLVIRGWDHGRGYDSARTFGSEQADAIRNIIGATSTETWGNSAGPQVSTGAFANSATTVVAAVAGGSSNNILHKYNYFDASLVVPTAGENRVRNRAYLPIIKVL